MSKVDIMLSIQKSCFNAFFNSSETESTNTVKCLTEMSYAFNKAGKELALFGGYSYYCDDRNITTTAWKCTTSAKCKGRFITTKDKIVLRAENILAHNHPPRKYVIKNGIYVKM